MYRFDSYRTIVKENGKTGPRPSLVVGIFVYPRSYPGKILLFSPKATLFFLWMKIIGSTTTVIPDFKLFHIFCSRPPELRAGCTRESTICSKIAKLLSWVYFVHQNASLVSIPDYGLCFVPWSNVRVSVFSFFYFLSDWNYGSWTSRTFQKVQINFVIFFSLTEVNDHTKHFQNFHGFKLWLQDTFDII